MFKAFLNKIKLKTYKHLMSNANISSLINNINVLKQKYYNFGVLI